MGRSVYGTMAVGFEFSRDDAMVTTSTAQQCQRVDHRPTQGPGPRCSVCGQQFVVVEALLMKPTFAAFLASAFEEFDANDPWNWLCESSSDNDGLVGLISLWEDVDEDNPKTILGIPLGSGSTYRPTSKSSQEEVMKAFKDMKRFQKILGLTKRPIELWLTVHMS